MDIRQCRRCRKLFNYVGHFNCSACVHELDDIFTKVRNYLYDHPQADMASLCEASGAEEEDVLGWLREGRLVLGGDAEAMLVCENCRKPIKTGRYCDTCAAAVRAQLAETAENLGGKTRPEEKTAGRPEYAADRPASGQGVWSRKFLDIRGGNK
ncbi:MAG: hypothetical protein LBF64_04155 [Oscillospiraceae bacterium]|jgi:hypothetical protein|nr:hypothetical protein [Oscillospiraceae bacterium]